MSVGFENALTLYRGAMLRVNKKALVWVLVCMFFWGNHFVFQLLPAFSATKESTLFVQYGAAFANFLSKLAVYLAWPLLLGFVVQMVINRTFYVQLHQSYADYKKDPSFENLNLTVLSLVHSKFRPRSFSAFIRVLLFAVFTLPILVYLFRVFLTEGAISIGTYVLAFFRMPDYMIANLYKNSPSVSVFVALAFIFILVLVLKLYAPQRNLFLKFTPNGGDIFRKAWHSLYLYFSLRLYRKGDGSVLSWIPSASIFTYRVLSAVLVFILFFCAVKAKLNGMITVVSFVFFLVFLPSLYYVQEIKRFVSRLASTFFSLDEHKFINELYVTKGEPVWPLNKEFSDDWKGRKSKSVVDTSPTERGTISVLFGHAMTVFFEFSFLVLVLFLVGLIVVSDKSALYAAFTGLDFAQLVKVVYANASWYWKTVVASYIGWRFLVRIGKFKLGFFDLLDTLMPVAKSD